MDIFQGDPALKLTANGSTLVFKGGQPVMDQGLENLVLISLFTEQGWAGNVLFDDPLERVGSDFLQAAKQPITLKALNDITQAAERALDDPLFGKVTVETTNPSGYIIQVSITIEPPGQDSFNITLSRNANNWTSQAIYPAHRRL